jgi:hypothetical protein
MTDTTNTQNAPVVYEVQAVTVRRGKGVNAAVKAQHAVSQGVCVAQAALMASHGASIGKTIIKAQTDRMAAEVYTALVHAVALNGDLTGAIITLAQMAQRPFTMMKENGQATRADWARLGEELKHDSKAAEKARNLYLKVCADAAEHRAAHFAKLAAPAPAAA